MPRWDSARKWPGVGRAVPKTDGNGRRGLGRGSIPLLGQLGSKAIDDFMVGQPSLCFGRLRGGDEVWAEERQQGDRDRHCVTSRVTSGHPKDVDELNRAVRPDGAKGFQVSVGGMGRQDHEVANFRFGLPSGNQFVDDPVERFSGQRGAPRRIGIRAMVDPEWHGRGPNNTELGREIVGDSVDDEAVGAHWDGGASHHQGPHGEKESRIGA